MHCINLSVVVYVGLIILCFFKSSSSDSKSEKGAFLIVSPNSVLYNWHEELMTWGYFKIGKFHKNKRVETLERATADKLDVVLTTYETLRNHWVRVLVLFMV